jgi:hypothetical protein
MVSEPTAGDVVGAAALVRPPEALTFEVDHLSIPLREMFVA